MQRAAIRVLSLILIAASTAGADELATLGLPDYGYVCVYADSTPTAKEERRVLSRSAIIDTSAEQLSRFAAWASDYPANAAYRLILCDTAEQIEQVFTLSRNEVTFDEAIEAANKQAGRPNACSKATVKAKLLEEVRDIPLRGDTNTIIKVVVTEVSDGERMLPVPLLEQFAVMPGKKGRGA